MIIWKWLWMDLNSSIASSKNALAQNLTAKGIPSTQNESLEDLANKVANISAGTPEKFITKSLTVPNSPTISVSTSVDAI